MKNICWLIKIYGKFFDELGIGTLKITNSNTKVNYWYSNYTPVDFKNVKFERKKDGSDKISLVFNNNNIIMPSILEKYDSFISKPENSKDRLTFNLLLYIPEKNLVLKDLVYELNAYSFQNNQILFELSSAMLNFIKFPRKKIVTWTCNYKFKSFQCGYKGNGVCNYSYSDCCKLGNENNFGGFVGAE